MPKKTTKSKKRKIKFTQICPKCNSTDIATDFSNAAAVSHGFLNVQRCNNCNHEGTFFPSIPVKRLKTIKLSQIKNKQSADMTFANGLFNTKIPVLSLFLIVMGIIMIFYKLLTEGIVTLLLGLLIALFYIIRKNKQKPNL